MCNSYIDILNYIFNKLLKYKNNHKQKLKIMSVYIHLDKQEVNSGYLMNLCI